MATKQGLGESLSKSNAALAALAMKGGDTWQKLIVYLCYAISGLGILVICLPPYETPKQLGCLAIIVVPLCSAVFFVFIRYRHLLGEQKPQAPIPPTSPTNIKLSSTTRDAMFEVLQAARHLVWDQLHVKQAALQENQVRANIFFPDYQSAGKPKRAFVLKIRPGLHIDMTEPELGITLAPGQGLTGHVFQTGEPTVAQRQPAVEAGWDERYQITPELAAIIHPKLKWIISMPLKGAEGKPIGVMNIDGLTHQFTVDDLYECSRKLTQSAIFMAGLALGI
jgi:hypothetical protein